MCEAVSARREADGSWRGLLAHFLHVIGVAEAEPVSWAAINQILGSSVMPPNAMALWSLLCGVASWKAIGKPLVPDCCPLQSRDLELCRTVIDGQDATIRLYDVWCPILVRYFTRFGCPAYECSRDDYASGAWMTIPASCFPWAIHAEGKTYVRAEGEPEKPFHGRVTIAPLKSR